MLKTTLTCFLMSAMTLFGQEEGKTPTQWQQSNPRVICMELSDYSKLTKEKQDLLKDNLLVFKGELKQSDIEQYEALHHQSAPSKIDYSENFTAEIKTWLFHHPDVKIISRSRYNGLTVVQQEKHDIMGTLVLIGEVLTLKDIQYYEENF